MDVVGVVVRLRVFPEAVNSGAWNSYQLFRNSSPRLARIPASRTTITRQPCRFPPLGANRALSRIREDDLVGDRIGTMPPCAVGGAHNLAEFHCLIMSVMSRARSRTAWGLPQVAGRLGAALWRSAPRNCRVTQFLESSRPHDDGEPRAYDATASATSTLTPLRRPGQPCARAAAATPSPGGLAVAVRRTGSARAGSGPRRWPTAHRLR